jgi:hypothetical protein
MILIADGKVNKKMKARLSRFGVFSLILLLAGCAALSGRGGQYRDPNMDFASIRTVAVLPFANLSHDQGAAERVRDILTNMLLATGDVYVLPPGEVNRGVVRAGIVNVASPSIDEVKKVGSILQANAVITGVVREYGEARSGSVSANVISMGLQLIETQTGKVVWSASSTEGGVNAWDRLFGGGGKPINDVTEKAVNDLIESLLK